MLSRAAFQLHAAGIVNSVQDGHPGFVPDEYLSAIAAETTVTVAELCTAGMWRRLEDGYEVLDRDLLQAAVGQFRRMDEDAELCQATGGHEPDKEYPDLCGKCTAALPATEDRTDLPSTRRNAGTFFRLLGS